MEWIPQNYKPQKTIRQLEEQIIRKYAYMFPKQNLSRPGWSPIAFGFEVGPGWAQLLEDMFDVIGAVDTNKKVVMDQVKEKFGDLRFYYHCEGKVDERTYALIDWIVRRGEEQSAHTCERCGKRAKIISLNGWYSCLCKPCTKIVKKERKARLGL